MVNAPDPKLLTALLKALGGFMLLMAIIVTAVFFQSYTGRRDVVSALRRGCERGALRNAVQANNDRAAAQANWLVATDSFQSKRTRVARTIQVRSELTGLRVLDSQIDRGDWRLLSDPRDRRAVASSPFRCNVAYPSASPFKIF